ncbi:hypothetical protein GOV03_01385 [Candidatus Woesearchaeota archaeon]|nr:hypothetical protein [Candidatus Woesearchaeota archaeon]
MLKCSDDMNPIKEGFLSAVTAIRKHKLLLIVLIVLQILFISSISFIGVTYQVKIYENAKGIIEPLENIDYGSFSGVETADQLEQPLMEDVMKKMISVTEHYQEMVKNIFEMLFLMLSCFLVFNGFGWSLSNFMVKKGRIVRYWSKFILVSLIFLIPAGAGSYFILKSFVGLDLEVLKMGLELVGGLLLVVSYFMLIGFGLVGEGVLGLFKNIFVIGFKKIHWMLLGLFCYLSLLGLSGAGVYFSMDHGIWMLLSGLFLIVVLVWGKLFFIGIIKSVKK